jgi:hypothetical protein
MWTRIILMAIIVVVATLIVRRQRKRNGTGGTPGDIRARAGKARKLDGGKPGGFSGKPGGNTPGMPG